MVAKRRRINSVWVDVVDCVNVWVCGSVGVLANYYFIPKGPLFQSAHEALILVLVFRLASENPSLACFMVCILCVLMLFFWKAPREAVKIPLLIDLDPLSTLVVNGRARSTCSTRRWLITFC